MKIDLAQYGQELEVWLKVVEPFTDRASVNALRKLGESLLDGNAKRPAKLEWKASKPIISKPAERYDGVDKVKPPVRVAWSFKAVFVEPAKVNRRWIWTIEELSTHSVVTLCETGEEILRFHHDLKNQGQLGPHVHMQVSEEWLTSKGLTPIAVPRFPAGAVLPTDCLDLVFSEFFPHEWPRLQADAVGINTLITAQQARFRAIAAAVLKSWDDKPKKTPIAAMQNCYMPELQLA